MPFISSVLLMHGTPAYTSPLPSLDAKCSGTSKYVGSNTYSAHVSTWGQVRRGNNYIPCTDGKDEQDSP